MLFLPGVAYGREPHPAFRAIADAAQRGTSEKPAAVFSHFAIWRAVQADNGMLPVVEPRRQFEWLGLVDYWKGGGTKPVWFLADARRTDLALIDPQSSRDVVRYRWSVADRPELSGTRPIGVDWYRFQPPGWFAGQGWSLTAETGGLARATAMVLTISRSRRGSGGVPGRCIWSWAAGTSAILAIRLPSFELAIDGQVRDRWTLTVDQRNFLRFLDLPEGLAAGDGAIRPLDDCVARGRRRRAPCGGRRSPVRHPVLHSNWCTALPRGGTRRNTTFRRDADGAGRARDRSYD